MDLSKVKPSKNLDDHTGRGEIGKFLDFLFTNLNPKYAYDKIKYGDRRQDLDFRNSKPSKNVEDRTGPITNFIKRRRDQFLVDTGLARSDSAFEEGLVPPLLRNQEGYVDRYEDVEWTPDEAKMIDRGMKPQDVFIMRAYKKLPGLVGK